MEAAIVRRLLGADRAIGELRLAGAGVCMAACVHG